MKTLHYCLIVVGLGLNLKAGAQTGISGKIKAEYVPFSNYIRPVDSVKTGSSSNFKRMQLGFSIPLSVKIDSSGRPKMWAVNVEGAYAQMENRDYEVKLFPTEMLNAQLGLVHMRPISKTWSIMAMASVGVYTDMEKITSDDILVQGGVLFIKHFNPRTAFGFGPVVSNTFGVPMILPGLYFNWVTAGRYRLHVNFPENIEFGVQMNPSFELKAVVELSGMTAEVTKDNKSMLLGYQQVVAGLRPEIKLGKSITLQLTAGTTLTRSFTTTSRKLKDFFKAKDMADPRFVTTAYGAVALKWNLSKAKK
ncbi:hypothetical protein TH53_22520 [Pedobacter lusitanus]|uniref:DUF6268 domain-containing protein n=1 Tax=Pedobacter lusitanus TaxID=1503925 RepID=A0A0D0FRK9_9SPHI|nr:DUF6268 family outer membrane beta-barrel protein [Pedobacter lusitanus]KIO75114.1 hypothetical protein TH53_22520 [Pedobacter lusitanus]